MRKFLPFVIVGILVLSGFGAVALNGDIEKIVSKTFDYKNTGDGERDFTHTILGEFGTATWCGYCKYAHAALKNIYAGGWFPFYYVSLVCDKNTHAYQRALTELGLSGYPTVYFDGGYKTNVGASSTPAAQDAYELSINQCGSRTVTDIDITLDVTWLGLGNPSPNDFATDEAVDGCLSWTNCEMNIDVKIDNNDDSSYDGHLHVFVTEVVSSMGWYDSGGYLYTFTFLDYAFHEDITISSGGTWQDDVNWDGVDYNNGYGQDFGGITQDNSMVIAAVFNENNDYVDETAGLLAGTDTDPKLFDVYFGNSTPPPKVLSNHSSMNYCPGGLLEFDTTYYWQIVGWDNQGSSITGPIWTFTTRGNDPPNTPSDPNPEDEETDVPINKCLSWTSEDPDGDNVTYDVYFGECEGDILLVSTNQSSTTYCPEEVLEFETNYCWKIVSWDVYGLSTSGPTWSFTTEENDPPNTPSDPDPADGATDVDIDEMLRWTGGDPNPGDKVIYDVYFGKSNPPPLVTEEVTQAAYDPGTMDLDTTYYWQIVSEDSQGLTTTGPIWHFTTQLEPNDPPGAPYIDGPNGGSAGTSYDYDFTAVDPDGNDVKYFINWGDDETEETSFAGSSTPVTVSHTWAEEGTYTITAYAEDVKGLQGPEATKTVTMPRNRAIVNPFFSWFLEKFPNALPILRYIFAI